MTSISNSPNTVSLTLFPHPPCEDNPNCVDDTGIGTAAYFLQATGVHGEQARSTNNADAVAVLVAADVSLVPAAGVDTAAVADNKQQKKRFRPLKIPRN